MRPSRSLTARRIEAAPAAAPRVQPGRIAALTEEVATLRESIDACTGERARNRVWVRIAALRGEIEIARLCACGL